MNPTSDRQYVIVGIFSTLAIIFVFRLFYLQVINPEFQDKALNMGRKVVVEFPMRGTIYDRNGHIMAHNEIAYDLIVLPKEVKVDTFEFCKLLNIDTAEFNRRLKIAKTYPNAAYKESVFQELISVEDFARISEQLYRYKGFSAQRRNVRNYPKPSGAHVLGYMQKVSVNDKQRDEFYVNNDYIGRSGLEMYYEKDLRGVKGIKYLRRDRNNNIKGPYKEGTLDEKSAPGKDLYTSIDAVLQEYAEQLMQGKRGSIVAIDPSTGEVLCMVSAPTYNPNDLVGRYFSKNYDTIFNSPGQPLFFRSIAATQPPGSIVKTMQAAIAQQFGVANPNTRYPCNKSLVGCHDHPGPLNLPQSVQSSCNPYYYNLVKTILYAEKSGNEFTTIEHGLNRWEDVVRSFGMGNPLHIDLAGEKDGNVPDSREYNKTYGRGHWNYRTVYSLSIGQGEFALTPLQMTNLAVIIANKGKYYTPHVVKKVGDRELNYKDSVHVVKVESKYFDVVQDGMQWVIEERGGTAGRAKIDSLHYCGKTGTSQNPHGEDHSVFIAFAPRENPKIAISVYIENAGKGGLWAAPIASLVIEKYLRGQISRKELEEDMLKGVIKY
ncbi:MAG: penicillin-binding protein 2 [Bacteroidetes bacterium]|nr:penicillin-binding protein 2 [Bacteroidota bacterium]